MYRKGEAMNKSMALIVWGPTRSVQHYIWWQSPNVCQNKSAKIKCQLATGAKGKVRWLQSVTAGISPDQQTNISIPRPMGLAQLKISHIFSSWMNSTQTQLVCLNESVIAPHSLFFGVLTEAHSEPSTALSIRVLGFSKHHYAWNFSWAIQSSVTYQSLF